MRERRDIRLFFALWPDEQVREEMAETIKLLPAGSGRVVPQYNWHMTLHFIGNTTFDEKDCLDKQARKVRQRRFQLFLDQTGFFKNRRCCG